MCGIAGIAAFNENGKKFFPQIHHAVQSLQRRGPDANNIFSHNNMVLAHTRLSVIDTSAAASQPMTDASGRFTIVFNGEFFNFKEHREFIKQKGYKLSTESDTEVLLYLYLIEKEKCLQRLNGFFSFAIYDQEEESLFLARDRFGVKPFLYYLDDDKLVFASEMKALMAMGIPKETDDVSLFTYLQLNYIPGPDSIFKRVKKLLPGTFLKINLQTSSTDKSSGSFSKTTAPLAYYTTKRTASELSYPDQQKKLAELMDASVQRRLISDVPLGAFLSGGIDSSVIVALASRHVNKLNTFSIGFRDEPLFDETKYANLVAQNCKTNHTVFSLSNDDLFDNLFNVLDYIDEPFADSSALAVYILSKQVRKHVTVALSGDGADELFGGYNKHAAEWRARNGYAMTKAVLLLAPLLKILPQSRNSKYGNKFRQLNRFAEGMKLDAKERYWRWAGFESEEEVKKMLVADLSEKTKSKEYQQRKSTLLQHITHEGDLNDVFYTDMKMVLPGDMLTKVDLMSMANSLEVRTPFLDYEVVDFAFSLPVSSKIDRDGRKKIIRDAFRPLLPEELYHRNKQGFEVPLLKWFRSELKSLITDDLLEDRFITEQNIFHVDAIRLLKQKLFSSNPSESVAQVWALIVFQYWWKKNMK